ncbi:ABC transporter substrate-binding protein [Dermatophilus congolensis]|uniref:ABC transporter substrate-binding protein n=1 Tax=Dermatophilus congolensis TaxID=1863 RepID=UPI001AAF7207|nr:ABC transporter substrate-binding protein [Dermatophilus congolensis]MBO3143742.1 ABC transporter substrate-binding protein [Dermatophilus congolensis]MBO3152733.1 ABC transporter substrate-binding protein [Dermatophilus congolensis]MBO3160256.1 ABC transporter substrate-binding protein [Dermatophilus congolensis]MBO3164018.1 ABC transporter substrate-binding protein [Dermatophilus congolensis]MBO3177563.1 ABC transporter substrate-binding protein [Dermatophilus congolensis]
MKRRHLVPLTSAALALALGVSACSSGSTPGMSSAAGGTTITNCGQPAQFPASAKRFFVNDSGMIAMMLAIGAGEKISGFSSLEKNAETLARHYGKDALGGKQEVSNNMPALETLIAQRPDVVVAGWNYGYKENQVTPKVLQGKNIAPYILTESCRQKDGQKARGVTDPWTALDTDLKNLGTLTGKSDQAAKVIEDISQRRKALENAPQAEKKPNVLVFDSGTETVFTSGKFGGPQAVIDTAGGRNVMEDVNDTWTTVSWERVAASKPDAIVFVSYGEQSMAQKIALLEANPSTKDLPAVKEKRYVNLPYAMWVSSPLNIDASEQLRSHLEEWELVPESKLPKPKFDDTKDAF